MNNYPNDPSHNTSGTPNREPPATTPLVADDQFSDSIHRTTLELEGYLHRTLSVNARKELERHIGICDACMSRLAKLSTLQPVRHQHWHPICITLTVAKQVFKGLDKHNQIEYNYQAEANVNRNDSPLPHYEVYDRLLVAGARAKVHIDNAAHHLVKVAQEERLEVRLNGGQTKAVLKWERASEEKQQKFNSIHFDIVDPRFVEGTLTLIGLYEKDDQMELVVNTLDPRRLSAKAAEGLRSAFGKETRPSTLHAWKELATRTLEEHGDLPGSTLHPDLRAVFEEIKGSL